MVRSISIFSRTKLSSKTILAKKPSSISCLAKCMFIRYDVAHPRFRPLCRRHICKQSLMACKATYLSTMKTSRASCTAVFVARSRLTYTPVPLLCSGRSRTCSSVNGLGGTFDRSVCSDEQICQNSNRKLIEVNNMPIAQKIPKLTGEAAYILLIYCISVNDCVT